LAVDLKPRALFLVPEAPYPLAGGGALRTASLIHGLARSHELDLIVFRQPMAPDPRELIPAGLAQHICVIDLPVNSRSLAARGLRNAVRLIREIPPLVDRYSGFEREVASAIEGRRYEVAIIEHFWCAGYWEQLRGVADRVALDLHNVESALHESCAVAEGGAERFAHRMFARAALELERIWLPRFSVILAASAADRDLIRKLAGGARITVYPNAIPLPPLPPSAHECVIVFSGNLEYHPNISAVRFFRRQVWPRLRDQWPELIWRLVGRNPEAVRQWTKGEPRIEVTGPVEDAIAELARAQVVVVPILAGSGTRLKILEAWGAARPVVSTSLGAEGLGAEDGRHLLLADGAEPFARAVSRLLQDAGLRQELACAGRALLESQFTWEKAWQHLEL
jgi:glycosyltransferase involved in cell wall biosynthesis